jgi:uncharacterized protein (DUF433 family)
METVLTPTNFSKYYSVGVSDSSCDKLVTEGVMVWIVSDADHLGGKPRVRDTRIAVALVLEWLTAGMTIDEIVKEYPSLTKEAVRGTLEELAHSELLAPSENPSRREHA